MRGTLVRLGDMYLGDRTTEKDCSLGDFHTTLSEMQVIRKLAWICGPSKILENIGMNLQQQQQKEFSQTYDSLAIIDYLTKNKLITNSTNQKPCHILKLKFSQLKFEKLPMER